MRTYAVIVIMLLVVLYACKHEVVKPPVAGNPDSTGTGTGGSGGGTGGGGTGGGGTGNGGGSGGGTGGTTTFTFDSTILPIFQQNCATSGCHDANTAEKDYVLDSYANIVRKGIDAGDADGSKIYRFITETDPQKIMPPPPKAPLSATQIALIKQWIDAGATQTWTTGTSTGCNLTNITYSGNIKPIINANCISCHSGSNPSGGLDYTTHAGLSAVATSGQLVGAINHAAGFSPMPRGAAKLDACTIQQITKWVNDGAPNN
jgi:hypothetical protein